MVLSYNQPPYDSLMRAQVDTFDSIPCEDVNTLFYYGSSERSQHHKIIRQHHKSTSHELQVPFTDAYYLMGGKMKMALDYVKDWEYDIIFRTNSSSYTQKEKLVEFAATLPKEKLYAGWEIEGNAGYNVVSGAGIFMSRDVAEILRQDIDPEFEREEDCVIAEIISRYPEIKIIDDKSRFDYPQDLVNSRSIHDAYHIRFKTGDRLQDAENMRLVHQQIINQ